jgi:lysozyme
MTDKTRLRAQVRIAEGYRARPYKDSRGLWTFGNGRCLETHPLTGAEWKELLDKKQLAAFLSIDGADSLEEAELDLVEADLARDLYPYWAGLNDARQNALIEMAYQMGVQKEEAFHDMLTCVSKSDWPGAYAAGMDSDWARETPPRAQRVLTQLSSGTFPVAA